MREAKVSTSWRIDLAHQIAGHLRHFDNVAGIAVAGSVARGFSDDYSDLEIATFWNVNPTDERRSEIVSALKGSRFASSGSGQSCEDSLLIKGFQVDIWHNEVQFEEKVLTNVLTNLSTNLGENNFLETVQNLIPLYDNGIIADWKVRSRDYPFELGKKFVKENISFFKDPYFEMHIARKSLPLLFSHISGLQKRVFLTLLGLNNVYFPGFKWMLKVCDQLAVKPPHLSERLSLAFQSAPFEACQDILKLMAEVLDLVGSKFPDVDCDSSRKQLKTHRRKWDTGPQL